MSKTYKILIFIISLLLFILPVGISTNDIKADDNNPLTTNNCLTFKANDNNSSLVLYGPSESNIEISTDDGNNWNSYTLGTTINLNKDDKVSFRAKTSNSVSNGKRFSFEMEGSIAGSGDVTSLTNGVGGDVDLSTLGEYCYRAMFKDCISLTSAPNLPSTTLVKGCYKNMFSGCTNLVKAPTLNASTLTEECYYGMFYNCSNLENAPALPATTLAVSCYSSMFEGCSKLTTLPSLQAEKLKDYCYQNMFKGCTSLENPPALPAASLAKACYKEMFSGCTNLVTAPTLNASTLTEECYDSMFINCSKLETAPNLKATTLASSCYSSMFQGCSKLTTAPSLQAEKLEIYCYRSMFSGCTSLVNAPDLPSRNIAEECYSGMFYGCTSLEIPPELPATTLANYCYYNMFFGCTSLLRTPELPAKELTNKCYFQMFGGCSSLSSPADMSHVTKLGSHCCDSMYYGPSKIRIYTEEIAGYSNTWTMQNMEEPEKWNRFMFPGVSQEYPVEPKLGDTYYILNDVYYDSNEATGGDAPLDNNNYVKGNDVTIKDNTEGLVIPNYEFGGWNTKPNGRGTDYIPGNTFKFNGSILLYAKWVANILYNPNGSTSGDVPVDENTYLANDKAIILDNINDLKRTAYDFSGWNTNEDGKGIDYSPNQEITIEGCLNLYPKWTPITYTITYHLDGGIEETNPTSYNIETETITLNNPTKTGYTFKGFYDNPEFTGSTITTINKGSYGDKDLYAKFTPNTDTPYVIKHLIEKLDGNYELIDTDNQKGTSDSKVTPSTKSYEGFTAPSSKEITIAPDGTTELEYKYTRNSYDLTVTKGKGIDTCSTSNTYKYEQQVNLSATLKTGYENITYSGDVTTSSFTIPAKDIDITISASPITYTITYHLDGGIEETNPTSYNIETNTITLNNPTKTGYTFKGFFTNEELTNPITTITKGSTGNLNIYAKWEIINYTITYHLDGGIEETNPTSYNIETNTITLYKPIKKDHTFVDYYNNPEFTGDPITTIPKGSTGNKDIYAKYYDIYIKKEETNPTFDGRYGTISYQKESTNDCKITLNEDYPNVNKVEITNTKTSTQLTDQDFEVTRGSTKITIKDSYLKKLDVGTYSYSITLTTTASKSYTYYLTITINQKPEPTPPYRPVDTSCK